MSKNWGWKKTGLNSDRKFTCSENFEQNIWNKMEKCSKTGQEKKSLVSIFARFLTAIGKV